MASSQPDAFTNGDTVATTDGTAADLSTFASRSADGDPFSAINATNPNQHRVVSSPKIWASLITNANYLPGLLTLDYGFKRSGSAYPLVALYTDELEDSAHAALDARRIPKKRIQYILPDVDKDYSTEPRFKATWSKLAAFSLVEYERVVLVDSDMIILKNMDELMDLPLDAASLGGEGSRVFAAGHACVCNPMKKPHYPPSWVPENCAFTKQHADPDEAQVSGATNKDSNGLLNSGILVLHPGADVYGKLLQKLADTEVVKAYVFPDQDLLADVFRERWVPLSYIYNGIKMLRRDWVHGPIWRDDRVKNVHMIFSPKAWDEKRGEESDETHKWWRDMDDERKASEKAKGLDDGC